MHHPSLAKIGPRPRASRAAASSAIESLETRTLFAYALADTFDTPAPTDPILGSITLATQGDFALIGQPGGGVDGTGSAYLINTSLPDTDPQHLVREFANPGDAPAFGFAVAFVGSSIAISAPDENFGGTPAVYIYDSATDTTPTAIGVPPGYATGSGFGRTITAVDGDSILIAAPLASFDGHGIVQQFNVSGALEGEKFVSAFDFDQIGTNMASNGTRIAMTANEAVGTVSNGVHILEYTAADHQLIRSIHLPTSLAATLAYGADGSLFVGDFNNNSVYRFASDSSTSAVSTYTAAGTSNFGLTLAVSGNHLLVTSPSTASAYVFDYIANPGDQTEANAEQIAAPTDPSGFGNAAGATTDGFLIGQALSGGGVDALYLFEPVALPTGPSAEIVGGDLIVTGTGIGELILVKSDGVGLIVLVDGIQVGGTFAVTGKVIVHGGAGSDTITSDKTNPFAAEIYGGDGSDTITGGGGDDLLFGEAGNDVIRASQGSDVGVGGDGNDVLYGGAGRDVLIGGRGSDRLEGDNGEDILVAGYTIHDADPAALASIRTTWNSGATYSVRVDTLATGLLHTTSVFEDGEEDLLSGGNGQDWFVVIGAEDSFIGGTKTNEVIS
ncbi:MAG TPA: hypothetical protein VGR35_02065 [Tepidisphaeraceae bacterium]|nr:hypothetical protein [Tepidisphaeraceae bacterium]